MRSKQCNKEFGYQHSICSRTKENTENLDRFGRHRNFRMQPSQELPDANWFLDSSPALNTRTLTLFPICTAALFEKDVCTSQQTQYVSVTETNRLMLFRETDAVYCEKLKLIFDRQSVGQSVLVSVTHLGPAANFPLSLKFSIDSCGFVIL
jgi:hypothetical protein